jgi:cytochrome bd-type quinol oxidase subunit 2
MDTVALLLSRLAFTILIPIIFSGLHTDFPSFGPLPSGSWPYMIPFVLTIEEAAALQSSLACMFWGEGVFLSFR